MKSVRMTEGKKKETVIERMDNRVENEEGADAAYSFEELKSTSN